MTKPLQVRVRLDTDKAACLRAAEKNLAAFVFSTHGARGLSKDELWELLPEKQKREIRNFIANIEGFDAS